MSIYKPQFEKSRFFCRQSISRICLNKSIRILNLIRINIFAKLFYRKYTRPIIKVGKTFDSFMFSNTAKKRKTTGHLPQ